MQSLSFTRLITTLGKFFTPPQLSIAEQSKRGIAALLLLGLILALLGVGIATFSRVGISATVIMCSNAVLVSLAILVALRYVRDMLLIFRSSQVLAIGQLAFGLTMGSDQGAAMLWFYIYPVTTFFLGGTREGLFWVLLSWCASFLILIFRWGPYPYPQPVSIHFIVVYSLVCLLTYGLEASRSHYYTQLQEEKATLEAALLQVKTLQGLLPICASCKKIRDDQGYWHQVESYFGTHSELEFSHSICPECRTKLYPSLSGQKGNFELGFDV